MEIENFKTLIEKNFTQREIAEELKLSQTAVRYWLKKFNLKTNTPYKNKTEIIDGLKVCNKCYIKKPLEEFYERSDREGHSPHCKKCSTIYHGNRVRDVKIRMINYKGGKCERCSLRLEDTHYSVFDFHHLDPKEKDANFDRIKYKKWEVIQKEIDKCKLLCANCHRITHAELGGNN